MTQTLPPTGGDQRSGPDPGENRSAAGDAVLSLDKAMTRRLREARERSGFKLGRLTRELGITRQRVWQIESGTSANVRAQLLDRWCQLLGWPDHRTFFASEALDPPMARMTAVRVRQDAAVRAAEAELYAADTPEAARIRAGVMPVIEGGDDLFYMVPHVGKVAAGEGRIASYTRVEGYVPVYRADVQGRELIAVTVTGRCMEPRLSEGDTVICVKVNRPEEVQGGALCVVTILDEGDGENDGGNVKYVEWASAVARLHAEDRTTIVVPRHRLKVEGRVWRIIKELF